MSRAQPVQLDVDHDDVFEVEDYEDELSDITDDANEPEIVTINDEDDLVAVSASTPSSAPAKVRQAASSWISSDAESLPKVNLPYIIEDEYMSEMPIRPGDTVELHTTTKGHPSTDHSGDFLRVRRIIRNVQTDEVTLQGYRLRRTKYQNQLFDWKLNELVLVLHTTEGDSRSPFIQGLVDISVKDVLCKRECIITNRPYPLLSFRDAPVLAQYKSMNKRDIKRDIFEKGRLICRWAHILTVSRNGKAYAGEVRGIYGREADHCYHDPISAGASRLKPIYIDEAEGEDEDVVIRSPISQAKEHPTTNAKTPPPVKKARYTFGDVFCGAGGASQGAADAGLQVLWGLDFDEHAIAAYRENFPSAAAYHLDAHEFPPKRASKEQLRVDILHLSPPCRFWSPAHTNPGQDDQANFEAIYTVGPILSRVKPRIATLEQTFGLATHEQHKKNFRLLINDINKAGYDVRYKIQDLSEFGLPQRRKRLLMIAARRGTPVPAFPRPTHGSPRNGLNPLVSIWDALEPLRQHRAIDDDYHKPHAMRSLARASYDPKRSLLKGCVTTGGGENHHYSGTRKFTVRETSLLQGFPMSYKFTGSHGEAMKQVGNAFPPVMGAPLYTDCARVLEAFDHGLIGAEEYISDLDSFLDERGITIAPQPSTGQSFFNNADQQCAAYRYLVRQNSSQSSVDMDTLSSERSLWSRDTYIEPAPKQDKRALPYRPSNRRERTEREKLEQAEANGDVIEIE